jgi:hypothetical protein
MIRPAGGQPPGRPIGRLGSGHPQGVIGVFLVTHLNKMPFERPTFDLKEWHKKFLTRLTGIPGSPGFLDHRDSWITGIPGLPGEAGVETNEGGDDNEGKKIWVLWLTSSSDHIRLYQLISDYIRLYHIISYIIMLYHITSDYIRLHHTSHIIILAQPGNRNILFLQLSFTSLPDFVSPTVFHFTFRFCFSNCLSLHPQILFLQLSFTSLPDFVSPTVFHFTFRFCFSNCLSLHFPISFL